MNFTHDNFSITITKAEDTLTVRFVDTTAGKTFERSYHPLTSEEYMKLSFTLLWAKCVAAFQHLSKNGLTASSGIRLIKPVDHDMLTVYMSGHDYPFVLRLVPTREQEIAEIDREIARHMNAVRELVSRKEKLGSSVGEGGSSSVAT